MKFIVGSYEYNVNRADMTITVNGINLTINSNDTSIDPIQMDENIRPILSQGFSLQMGTTTKTYTGFLLNSIREVVEETGEFNIYIDCYKPN